MSNIKSEHILQKNNNQRIAGLEALKTLCAFMVVSLHARSFIGSYIYPVCIIAVPIFFMISGYFLLHDIGDNTEQRLKRNFYKCIKLYLLSFTVYLIWNLTGFSVQHGEDFYNTGLFDIFRDFLFNGTGQSLHLWYLTTSIYTFLFIIILLRFRLFKYVYILASIGLVLNIFIDHYDFTTWTNEPFRNFFLIRNVFLQGVPYMVIGALCHRYENFFSFRNSSAIVVISLCLMFMQQAFPGITVKLYPVPMAAGTMMLFKTLTTKGPILNRIAYIGQRYSLGIYLWHLIVCDIISYAFIFLIGGIPLSIMSFIKYIVKIN